MLNNMLFYGLSNKKLNKLKNSVEYQNWYCKLVLLAVNIFEWENLPERFNPFLMELVLLNRGCFAAVDLPEFGGLLTLPAANGGKLSIYGYPTTGYCWGFDGTNRKFEPFIPFSENFEDCNGIFCYDNSVFYPFSNYIFTFAQRLSDITRSIDTASKKLKTPYFITADEKQKASYERILANIDENSDAIFGHSPLNVNDFQVLNANGNPAILTALWDNFNNTYDLFKEIFGINSNAQSDKKERLLVDEVNGNNEVTSASLANRLQQRKAFCTFFNKWQNTNIDVKIKDFSGVDNKSLFDTNFEKEVTDYE